MNNLLTSEQLFSFQERRYTMGWLWVKYTVYFTRYMTCSFPSPCSSFLGKLRVPFLRHCSPLFRITFFTVQFKTLNSPFPCAK